MRCRAALAAVLVCWAAGACGVDVGVAIDLDADGSGTVSVAVALDEAATTALGDPTGTLRLDDVRAAGWRVAVDTGPTTTIRAERDVASAAEADAAVQSLTGSDGPLGGLRISARDEAFRRTVTVSGPVDLSDGMASFVDAAARRVIGPEAIGAVDEAASSVAVDARVGTERASVAPSWGAEAVIDLAVRRYRSRPMLWAALAALGALSAAVVAAAGVRRLRRPRGVPGAVAGGS